MRTGADLAGLVVGVEQSAGVDREAAAADAGREPVAERLQGGDLAVEVVAPATGEPLPVAARGSATSSRAIIAKAATILVLNAPTGRVTRSVHVPAEAFDRGRGTKAETNMSIAAFAPVP